MKPQYRERVSRLLPFCLPAALFLSLAAFPPAWSQEPPSERVPTQVDREKLIPLDGFDVKGTRLPSESVIRLSGLKVGQQVNYNIVNEACHKITSTGLVKLIDYAYDMYPGKPGIVLSLKLVDEQPLFPAKIVPAEDAGRIWQCLQSADPIFTRELPRTEKALTFYEANILRCLKNQGRVNEYASSTVACDAQGNASEIIFAIKAYKEGQPHK